MREEYSAVYAELYRRHWWWRARETVVLDVIRRLPLGSPARILDVGCGDGLLFPALEPYGDPEGIEIDESLLDPEGEYRDRISNDPISHFGRSGRQFDLVLALDVLEHIEEDGDAVADTFSLLKTGGFLVVTVPALPSLWSNHDVINEHYRRYTRRGLLNLLRPHGQLLELRFLFHFLVFFKYAVKFLGRLEQHTLPPAWINRALRGFLVAETRLLHWARVPFGSSLLAVVQKPADPRPA